MPNHPDQHDGPIARSGVLKLFPTYVWATQLKPEAFRPINEKIVAYLRGLQTARPELAGKGQWQTSQDLHKQPALADLVAVIQASARSICDSMTLIYDRLEITGCWANLSQRGFPHRQHFHPNNYLSGAYYVKTAPGADRISFHDPRPQAGMLVPPARNQDLANPDQVSLDVSDGMLVMFPAWLQHSVAPNQSEITRISVAFNLMFPEFGTRMANPLWQGDTAGD